MRRHARALAMPLSMISIGAISCAAPEFGETTPEVTTREVRRFANQVKDVDILFVIDDSPSMTPKQRALAAAIPQFIQRIEATGANYQIGVVTSDVGATPQGAASGLANCQSSSGDDGLLQRTACSARGTLSQEAVSACQTLCPDARFVPQGGAGFIRKVDGATNVPVALDAQGRDLGPQRAFQCLALVGDGGCGVEGTLEGMRRALDGHRADNKGFPRPGALLSVIVISDEDDCSLSAAGRREMAEGQSQTCDTPDANAVPGCYNPDYRCLARSTICDQPLNTPGAKSNCRERIEDGLIPVNDYAAFLRGLRPDQSQLLLAGIYTLPPLTGGGRLVVSGDTSQKLGRALGANAGCVDPSDPRVFGQPQHRLSKLLGQLPGSLEVSVCDTARYPAALDTIAEAIRQRLAVRCLAGLPQRDPSGTPACLVGDGDSHGGAPARAFPVCAAGCCAAFARSAVGSTDDPAIQAACAAEAAPCYCAVAPEPGSAAAARGLCKQQDGASGAILGVYRPRGQEPPPESQLFVQCKMQP